jgi:hypothetical protein
MRIIRRAGGDKSVLYYGIQQIQQFRRSGEEWIMPFPDVDQPDKFEAELRRSVLLACPPHERLEGLSPEELLQSLPPQERRRLKELLDQEDKQDSSED